jgi:hypothetical protein
MGILKKWALQNGVLVRIQANSLRFPAKLRFGSRIAGFWGVREVRGRLCNERPPEGDSIFARDPQSHLALVLAWSQDWRTRRQRVAIMVRRHVIHRLKLAAWIACASRAAPNQL